MSNFCALEPCGRLWRLAALLLFSAAARAQVGIGTTTPNASAALHLRAPHKGLLINQVNLASLADAAAVASPAFGLLVFNTNAALPGGQGFYYNAGTAAAPLWTKLNTGAAGAGDNLGNGVAATDVNLNGNRLLGGTAAAPSPDGLQVSGAGRVGIGLGATVPAERLHLDGGHLKIGAAPWSAAANDRLLKFGDGDFVTVGETDGDDLLQFRAKDFRFNGSSTAGGGYAGRVGIGLGPAVAPSEALEVGGNVKLTGPAGTTGLVFPDGTKQTTAATGGGGALTLPYSGSANPSASGPVFQITNTGSGSGLRGASASGQGVVGRVNGTGPGQGVVGVKGTNVPNIEDAAVVGLSDADYAVYARSKQQTGVFGTTEATTAAVAGVRGFATSGGTGVSGESSSGPGVAGSSTTNVGVVGSSGDDIGVRGTTAGSGPGVAGVVGRTTSSTGVGVYGSTHAGVGVFGDADTPGGRGVQGQASQANGTAVVALASGPALAFNATTTGTGSAAYFSQGNTGSSAAAVTVRQRGTGPALVLDNAGPGYGMGMGLGIGTAFPRTQLSITPATTEAKITLFDGGDSNNHYGFGVSGFQLNYHVNDANARHVFYAGGKNGDGAELLRIQGNGRVGVGTANPQDLLDVAGAARAVEVHTPTTGAANLLPVAYGRLRADGSTAAGTGNFTSGFGGGFYTVTFTAASGLSGVNFNSAVILATPNGSTAPIYGFAGGAGQVQFVFDPAGAQDTFSFTVYRP